jgi:hypothetical protein
LGVKGEVPCIPVQTAELQNRRLCFCQINEVQVIISNAAGNISKNEKIRVYQWGK